MMFFQETQSSLTSTLRTVVFVVHYVRREEVQDDTPDHKLCKN